TRRASLHLLQHRAPPLRDRHAHPGVGPLRHRDRGPGAPSGHPRPRPRADPRAVHPAAPTAAPARAGVDRPAHPSANKVGSAVSVDLTTTVVSALEERYRTGF